MTVSASTVIHVIEQGVTSVTCTATALPSPDVFFHNFTCTEDLIGEGEEGEAQDVISTHVYALHSLSLFLSVSSLCLPPSLSLYLPPSLTLFLFLSLSLSFSLCLSLSLFLSLFLPPLSLFSLYIKATVSPSWLTINS